MIKVNNTARISVNKLGEYMDAKAKRRTDILREMKYPQGFITAYYKEAREAISHFLAANMEDNNTLSRQVHLLNQRHPSSVRDAQRIKGNIEAIESFNTLTGKIDFKGAMPRLAPSKQQKLQVRNVTISVEPEIILAATGIKNKNLVGGIKLHFPKAHPLSEDACGYISTAMYMHHDAFHQSDGTPHANHCIMIDVPAKAVRYGVTAVKQRQKEIEAACDEIYRLWPSITSN